MTEEKHTLLIKDDDVSILHVVEFIHSPGGRPGTYRTLSLNLTPDQAASKYLAEGFSAESGILSIQDLFFYVHAEYQIVFNPDLIAELVFLAKKVPQSQQNTREKEFSYVAVEEQLVSYFDITLEEVRARMIPAILSRHRHTSAQFGEDFKYCHIHADLISEDNFKAWSELLISVTQIYMTQLSDDKHKISLGDLTNAINGVIEKLSPDQRSIYESEIDEVIRRGGAGRVLPLIEGLNIKDQEKYVAFFSVACNPTHEGNIQLLLDWTTKKLQAGTSNANIPAVTPKDIADVIINEYACTASWFGLQKLTITPHMPPEIRQALLERILSSVSKGHIPGNEDSGTEPDRAGSIEKMFKVRELIKTFLEEDTSEAQYARKRMIEVFSDDHHDIGTMLQEGLIDEDKYYDLVADLYQRQGLSASEIIRTLLDRNNVHQDVMRSYRISQEVTERMGRLR